MRNTLTDQFIQQVDMLIPGVSLDCVVFGYRQGVLKVLLLKYRNAEAWSLPGGFLPSDAEMESVASDILMKRTGLKDVFLTQHRTFSGLSRGWDANEQSQNAFSEIKKMWPEEHKKQFQSWFDQRFISTAYVALIDSAKASLVPDHLSECCAWVSVNELPTVVLDHAQMIASALAYLKMQINYLPIGKSLLADRFTMSDLKALYEAILQKELDRGNFQRKMHKLGILIRHEKLMTGASNKAPYLYSIDDSRYNQLLIDGIGFQ
ncbi:MAG: 8-oxo-dGTP diphosphatase [Paraglaciecola sp.]|jgi:8-oxo-dGTP diphosphatase